jgi:hypothetical protein
LFRLKFLFKSELALFLSGRAQKQPAHWSGPHRHGSALRMRPFTAAYSLALRLARAPPPLQRRCHLLPPCSRAPRHNTFTASPFFPAGPFPPFSLHQVHPRAGLSVRHCCCIASSGDRPPHRPSTPNKPQNGCALSHPCSPSALYPQRTDESLAK